MEFLAHISDDGRKQTVQEHLEGTARLCSEFAAEFDAAEQGYLAGISHDIGKYTEAFQRRLHGGPKVTMRRPARLSARMPAQGRPPYV